MRKEVHTGDMPTRQPVPIVVAPEGPVVREAETIELADTPMAKSDLDELAFMEERVTIRVEPLAEEFAPTVLDFYVNGRAEWVPVGQEWTLPRKYVEVIARAQPFKVRTQTGNVNDEKPENRIVRSQRAQYPFSVLHDPNPRGREWLTRIMRES